MVSVRQKQFMFLFTLLLSLSTFSLTYAKDYPVIQGTVSKVKDGDTVVITPSFGRKQFTCRLYGIDAPETSKGRKRGQPYGELAERELRFLVLHYSVEAILTGKKSYNREICFIRKNDVDINLDMVKRGYAWAYRQYLKRPYASEYIDAEEEAREKGLGLWRQRNPVPPWEFRRK